MMQKVIVKSFVFAILVPILTHSCFFIPDATLVVTNNKEEKPTELSTENKGMYTGEKKAYKKGVLYSTINYKKGFRDGVTRIYYEDGVVNQEYIYKRGKIEGLFKWYYPSGKVYITSEYVDGIKHGWERMYAENGSLMFERYLYEDEPSFDFKEYNFKGEVKERPKIEVRVIDKGEKSGKFKLQVSCPELSNCDYIIISEPFEGRFFHEIKGEPFDMEKKNGIGELVVERKKGMYIDKTVTIIVSGKTNKSMAVLVKRLYRLRID